MSFAPKGYKFEKIKFGKIDKIPIDWNEKPLNFFTDSIMGQSPPSDTYNLNNEGVPFLQGVTEFGEMFPNPILWCSSPKKLAESDQILFSVRAPVGKMNLSNMKICIGRGLVALKPKRKNNLIYCYYLLQQFNDRFIPFSQGVTYDAINKDELSKVVFPFTENISEQDKIGSILSNIDSLINKQKKLIYQNQNLMKSLLQKFFNEGLNNKSKNTKKVTLSPRFFKQIIPNGWELAPLGKFAKLQGGFAFKSEDYVVDGIRLLTISNVSQRNITWDEESFLPISFWEQFPEYQLKQNDLVMAMTRPIISSGLKISFFTSQENCFLNQRVGRFNTDSELDKKFLYYFTNSDYFYKQINVRAPENLQPNISSEEVEKIPIWIPKDVDEKAKIVEIFSHIESLICSEIKYLNEIKKIKKGVMQQILTGEIRVEL